MAEETKAHTWNISLSFSCVVLFMATQDIVGWALTMLSRQSVGYASV